MSATDGRSNAGAPDWAPPACDPAGVMKAIREEDFGACGGRLLDSGYLDDSNVIERMAIAFGILRKQQATQGTRLPASTVMWETLESIGTAVSPELAEQGSDALTVLQLADTYLAGLPVDFYAETRAFRALGRLWTAAFAAPSGMDLWIGNSAHLISNPRFRFFPRSPEKLPSGEDMGRYLAHHVDLLQAAIASNQLPERVMDWPITSGQWNAKIGRLVVEDFGGKVTLDVHRKMGTLTGAADQMVLKLVEVSSGQMVAIGRMTRITSRSGMYDEFAALASEVGGMAEHCVEACFMPDDLVGLWPRVRRALDETENYLQALGILETVYVSPRWRSRDVASACIRQMLVEYSDVGLVLGLTQPMELALPDDMSDADEALLCAAKMRITRAFRSIGGQYLVNGVMALQRRSIFSLSRRGATERF